MKTFEDSTKVCRICIQEKPVKRLRSIYENCLDQQLSDIANIQLNKSPNLPTNVCSTCLSHLKAAIRFKHKIVNAEIQLKTIFHVSQAGNEGPLKFDKDVSDTESENPQNTNEYESIDSDEMQWKSKETQESAFDETAEQVEEFNFKKETGDETKELKLHKCTECPKTFKYDCGLKAHNVKHGKLMECEPCKASFRSLKVYEKHLKQHPGYKPFSCAFCDKKFSVISTLKKHHVLHDTKNKHLCKTCGKSFVHGFVLKGHLRTHTGEKPYKCDICDATYSTSSFLIIHKRTHTMERPYKCEVCSKNFISKCALKAHSSTHSDEKKYICNLCGKGAARLPDLIIHMRFHTGEKPYACDQCPKRFPTSSNLAAHRRTHLGVKEHICEVCSKAFTESQTLKRHFRIHTGEKPYECTICGKRYAQSGQLTVHRKTHKVKEDTPELNEYL
ncbi:zinc finger protein 501-like [Cylas formicarius]|uniref:zinc finger protein 501-like n=1 Tax=Cylas formicarius TaxID=197179 RepID=UPI002958512E|nr:zinc finger protein 501-like [Cylas formicarius]